MVCVCVLWGERGGGGGGGGQKMDAKKHVIGVGGKRRWLGERPLI